MAMPKFMNNSTVGTLKAIISDQAKNGVTYHTDDRIDWLHKNDLATKDSPHQFASFNYPSLS